MSNQAAGLPLNQKKSGKVQQIAPRLRLFRAVKVMELTCHNLAVSYTNRISRFTSDVFRASGSPCTGGGNDGFVRGFVLRLPRCSCGALQSASPNNHHRLTIINCIPRAELQLKHSPVIQALIISVTESLYSQKHKYNEKNISQSFLCHQHKTIGVITVLKGFGERKQRQPKNWSNKL